MASSSPNDAAGSNDGPNKKSRLLELIQLPDSLDDAVLQPTSALAPHQADEAQLQALALSSGDDPAQSKSADVASASKADAGVPAPETETLMTTDNRTAEGNATGATTPATAPPSNPATVTMPQANMPQAAMPQEAPAGAPLYPRAASVEPSPSDPGVCVSCDVAADSSALDGLGGEEGEGEVASRRMGSASLAGGDGASGERAGGFEVFMGGLAPDAREEEVRRELEELAQGEVLSVRLQLTRGTAICKGYGFVTFADEAAAQRAVSAMATLGAARLCGRRVGLHASRRPFRAVLPGAQAAAAQPRLHLCPDPSASINALLGELRGHPDRRAAVAAALQVVQRGGKRLHPASAAAAASPATPADNGGATAAAPAAVATATAGPQRTAVAGGKRQATAAVVVAAAEGVATAQPQAPGSAAIDAAAAAGGVKAAAVAGPSAGAAKAADVAKSTPLSGKDGAPQAAGAAAATAGSAAAAASATKKAEKGGGGGSIPGGMSADLLAALTAYPKISKLINSLKGTTRVPKTPLMVLHEYATKMSYEASYLETSDGPAGPYTVESRLVSGGSHGTTIATASGKARTKKDAKQVSAAACLEKLLSSHRGLSPQDLLPVPKPPLGTSPGAAAAGGGGSGGSRVGKSGQDRGGAGSNSAAGGGRRTAAGGRPVSGPPPGSLPPHLHPHHRDALNRAGPPPSHLKLAPPPPPPPPPPLHRGAHLGGPSYGGGSGGQLGPASRGPFGGAASSGGGGGYSAVQPGLLPAGGTAVGGGGSPFGGTMDGPYGSGGRGQRPGSEPYGGGGGNGGSMVQLGLSGGASSASPGGPYSGLYGREGSRAGGGLGQDPYGGASSYDPAAGQKRNYSTAMQAAYGSPASSQGLLPVQPPQAPVSGAGGGMLGGIGGGAGSQGPFAVQAGGGGGGRDSLGMGGMGGLQQQQPVQQQQFLGQTQTLPIGGIFGQQAPIGQPSFGASQAQQGAFAQPLPGQSQQLQHQQQQPSMGPLGVASAAPPLQQTVGGYGQGQLQQQQQQLLQQQTLQQQQQLGAFQQAPLCGGGGGGAVLYGTSQAVQLQPAQPQPLLAQVQPQFQQQPLLGQSTVYGISAYSQPQVAQQQQLQQPQYGAGGMCGGMSQPQQCAVYSGGCGPPVQQQHLQHSEPQPYSLSGSSGLQAFGDTRAGGGLWG